jgi:hypothetical protein
VVGAGVAVTDNSGGYSLQLSPGTFTVIASGGGVPAPIARTVVIGNDNARLNFDLNSNGAIFGAPLDSPVNVILGTFTAFQANDTASSYSARVDWGNGSASPATLTSNGKSGFMVTGSADYGAAGAYGVRVLVTELSTGRTLALNATAVAGGPAVPTQSQGSAGSGHATAVTFSPSETKVTKVKKAAHIKTRRAPKGHAKSRFGPKKMR